MAKIYKKLHTKPLVIVEKAQKGIKIPDVKEVKESDHFKKRKFFKQKNFFVMVQNPHCGKKTRGKFYLKESGFISYFFNNCQKFFLSILASLEAAEMLPLFFFNLKAIYFFSNSSIIKDLASP